MAVVTIAITEATGEIAAGTQDGTYEEMAPKLRRLSNILGVVLGADYKAGEVEQHLHLHEDKATVQHRQQI